MENELTKALGLGDILSVSEYQRLTDKILKDNWLWNEVMLSLVAERGPAIIQNAYRQQKDLLRARIEFKAPAIAYEVRWEFLPEYQTARGVKAMIRGRYFKIGEQKHLEQVTANPNDEQQLRAISWYGKPVSDDVCEQYLAWLKRPDPTYLAELRAQQVHAAEVQQKKQAQLTGDLAVAVYAQTVVDKVAS
jgi:hypothetical protein